MQAAGVGQTVPGIAQTLHLARQGVQRIADELVSEGLARYADNPRHRRSKLLQLTDEGTAVLAAIQRAHRQWIKRIEKASPHINWNLFADELALLVILLREQDDDSTQ